jgi:zinc transport system substrate-binding protein
MNKRVRKIIIVAALIIALVSAGCSNTNDTITVEGKVNIVTSFYPLYDFAAKIGGEYINVVNLVPTGVEPHDWTPRAQDIVNIRNADLFIYNGADFEGWVDDVLDNIGKNSNAVIVEAAHGVSLIETSHDEDHGEDAHLEDDYAGDDHAEENHSEAGHIEDDHAEHDHEHGNFDPHIWLSPKQAKIMAANIKDALIQVDSSNEQSYSANYDHLITQLEELDMELTRIVQQSAKKEIVVSHESFGYIARDYGLTQVGVMGLSPDAEPTVKRMQEIKEFAEKHQVNYILFEELVSSKLAETLANTLKIETMVLSPLEGLTEEQRQAGEDYLSLMQTNLTTLEKVLQ